MLRELRVRNLAILDDVRVPFAPGLNVVTGATGSGKSLLLAALELLLGGRASREMLRTGADELRVEGSFEPTTDAQRAQICEVLGPDTFADDGALILRRRIDAAGRSRCDAQGAMVPVATLRDLGRVIVEIHGQSEHQALLESASQTDLLDRASDLVTPRTAFAATLAAWRDAESTLAAANAGHTERAAKLADLEAAAREISAARLRVGEYDELRAERSLQADATRHVAALAAAIQLVDGESTGDGAQLGAVDQLGRAARGIEHTAAVDKEVREALAALEDAAARAAEAARSLRAAADRVECDPERLEAIDDRLEAISRLLRRHGPGEEDALRKLVELDAAVEAIRGSATSSEALAARAAALQADVVRSGRALDAARRKCGAKLAKAVVATLTSLGMEGTRFEVAVTERAGDDRALAEHATALGLSPVEFLVAPNRGEDLRPLAKIASGGELARIALALRGEIAGGGDVALLVFDEIDADVGPRMGDVIGARLAALAKGRQVLAVTHLPQVAEMADHHIRAAKHADGERTVTVVEVLDGRARREEIDDMRGEGSRTRRKPASGRGDKAHG